MRKLWREAKDKLWDIISQHNSCTSQAFSGDKGCTKERCDRDTEWLMVLCIDASVSQGRGRKCNSAVTWMTKSLHHRLTKTGCKHMTSNEQCVGWECTSASLTLKIGIVFWCNRERRAITEISWEQAKCPKSQVKKNILAACGSENMVSAKTRKQNIA